MSNQRYPEELKIEAVKQVTERGLRVADAAERLGVSMKPRMCSDLAIDALLMAVWRRKPKQEVMIHSD